MSMPTCGATTHHRPREIAEDGHRIEYSARECVKLINAAMRRGNTGDLDAEFWHHCRGVLIVSADMIEGLTSAAGVRRRAGCRMRSVKGYRYWAMPQKPGHEWRRSKQWGTARHGAPVSETVKEDPGRRVSIPKREED